MAAQGSSVAGLALRAIQVALVKGSLGPFEQRGPFRQRRIRAGPRHMHRCPTSRVDRARIRWRRGRCSGLHGHGRWHWRDRRSRAFWRQDRRGSRGHADRSSRLRRIRGPAQVQEIVGQEARHQERARDRQRDHGPATSARLRRGLPANSALARRSRHAGHRYRRSRSRRGWRRSDAQSSPRD